MRFKMLGQYYIITTMRCVLCGGRLNADTNGPILPDGVECEHLAFRNNDVDWQIWIQLGSRPIPGFLLEPLGWVQDRLSQAIAVEPRLVELLFNLDHARMHLIALALAHMSGDVTP